MHFFTERRVLFTNVNDRLRQEPRFAEIIVYNVREIREYTIDAHLAKEKVKKFIEALYIRWQRIGPKCVYVNVEIAPVG